MISCFEIGYTKPKPTLVCGHSTEVLSEDHQSIAGSILQPQRMATKRAAAAASVCSDEIPVWAGHVGAPSRREGGERSFAAT